MFWHDYILVYEMSTGMPLCFSYKFISVQIKYYMYKDYNPLVSES